MVNAGAIVVSSLIKVSAILAFWKVLFSKSPCFYIPHICPALQGDYWVFDSFEGLQVAVRAQQRLHVLKMLVKGTIPLPPPMSLEPRASWPLEK